uniref:Variant surface glycoprotein 1125.233 n=1 Tax=Trypanosoma brucei TaxID=5691 RepID=A0A1J0R5F1_9TRYP|nr:variant surface glycoprotein 1125.233 [Trypanosoma brucei]
MKYPKGSTRVFALLAAAHLSFEVSDAAASRGLKNNVWQPIRGLSEELGLVGGDVLAHGSSALSYAKTLTIQQLRAQAYATKNLGTQRARQAFLYANYLSAKAAAAADAYATTGLESHIRAARASGCLKGRIDDFLKMLEQTKSSKNACLLQASLTTATAEHKNGKLHENDCLLDITPLTETKKSARTYVTAAGFDKLLHGDGSSSAHQPIGGSEQCNLLAAHNADGFTHTSSAANAVYTMAGYMKIPNSAGDFGLEAQENLKNKATNVAAAWQEAHQAISGVVTDEAADFTNDTESTEKWAKLTDIVKRVLLQKDKKSASDVEAAITNELGGKSQDKITELEGVINGDKIPEGVASLAHEKKLGAISSLTELTAILYHYELSINNEITNLKRKLQNKTEAKPTTTAEVCKSHATDAACRKAGCEFDKDKTPKCFPKPNESKEEKGKEGDDRKTGSASTCAGKPKGECKSPDCKWENNACKDSSFLVNKKLTLMAAAFVSLVTL